MVKQLRYYARFVVICMLLNRVSQVSELMTELSAHIDEYVAAYDADDQIEWQMVKSEIGEFGRGDHVGLTVTEVPVALSARLRPSEAARCLSFVRAHHHQQQQQQKVVSSKTPTHLSLQEIIIVGNCGEQTKFSELSLDMFRMLRAVERESAIGDVESLASNNKENAAASASSSASSSSSSSSSSSFDSNTTNPHKYLLYKPSFSQFFSYASAAFRELQPFGVLLIYISADAMHPAGVVPSTTQSQMNKELS